MKATLRNCSALSEAKDICSAPESQIAMYSPLRTRLTLWYVGAFSVVLIVFSAGVYFFLERILRDRIDANLRSTLQSTSSALARRGGDISASSVSGTEFRKLSLVEAFEDPHFPGQIAALIDANARVVARKPDNSPFPFRVPIFPLHASTSPQFYE